MGNWIVENKRDPEAEGNAKGQNVTDLRSRFTVANYLTPHSDIVALMVLEHQTECQNRIARALINTKQALHYQETLNRDLGEPADKKWESTTRRIDSAAEQLVKYMLFSGEAKLEGPIAGTSGFAREFEARGPFDKQGRSLRQFDLKMRLFKYPCSYLIYSRGFQQLPREVKSQVYKRLNEVLSGQDTSEAFTHLSAADRAAVLDILRETVKDFPQS